MVYDAARRGLETARAVLADLIYFLLLDRHFHEHFDLKEPSRQPGSFAPVRGGRPSGSRRPGKSFKSFLSEIALAITTANAGGNLLFSYLGAWWEKRRQK